MYIRLQKILANAGVASRRKAEEMISAGRVTVNGAVAALGAKAAPCDEICVDGVPLGRAQKKSYIALHKPAGIVTTVSDQFGRATVMDFVPDHTRFFPVGRLDCDTGGLLFLTNDGDWANALAHPSREVRKVYIATIRGTPTDAELRRFREGIKIDGRKTAPAEIEISRRSSTETTVKITIHEGRNRQVRKMCDAIGHPVVTLKRVAIGGVKLGDLPAGKWRYLSDSEVAKTLGAESPRS